MAVDGIAVDDDSNKNITRIEKDGKKKRAGATTTSDRAEGERGDAIVKKNAKGKRKKKEKN